MFHILESLVLPLLLSSPISLHAKFRRLFLSFRGSRWNSAFNFLTSSSRIPVLDYILQINVITHISYAFLFYLIIYIYIDVLILYIFTVLGNILQINVNRHILCILILLDNIPSIDVLILYIFTVLDNIMKINKFTVLDNIQKINIFTVLDDIYWKLMSLYIYYAC